MGNTQSLAGSVSDFLGLKMRANCFVKVEVFKWSSEEFPEEYAVIYTSIFDDASSCVLRVSANRDKARFTLYDGLCVNEEVLMDVEVNTVRDDSGNYMLGPEKVDYKGDIKATPKYDGQILTYECDVRRAHIFVSRYRIDNHSHSSMPREHLLVNHFLSVFRDPMESLDFMVDFTCHRNKGLQVELEGPLHKGKLYIDRKVEGNPADSSNNSIVKSEYVFPLKDSKNVAASYLSATGAINNVNAETHGKYNNSIFKNCHFHGGS